MSAAQSDQFATLLTGIRYAPVAALIEISADRRDSDSNNRRQQLQLGAQPTYSSPASRAGGWRT